MEIFECYKALGLPPDASREETKHAYRKLVNHWHPDRFARDNALLQLAEEHLKLFNAAYAEIKKHLASKPHRYRSAPGAASRPIQSTGVSPGFRQRRPPGPGSTVGSPTVLNRLTRKFRQMLAFWAPASPRPARIKRRSRPTTDPNPPTSGARMQRGRRTTPGKAFDEIFSEVAGPYAAGIKRAAARKKHGNLNRTLRRGPALASLKAVSGKTRGGHSPEITPISRIKRAGKIRRI